MKAIGFLSLRISEEDKIVPYFTVKLNLKWDIDERIKHSKNDPKVNKIPTNYQIFKHQ